MIAEAIETLRTFETASELCDGIFNDAYLARLRKGDEETARHFDRYFRRMLRVKVWRRFGPERGEDMVDEVMTAAMEKILQGQPRTAACLKGYILRICVNLSSRALRAQQNGKRVDLDLEQISDRVATCEERLFAEERAEVVRNVLSTLERRDRRVLVDLFCNELTRAEVCEKYRVTRPQMRQILFHARERFRRAWRRRPCSRKW